MTRQRQKREYAENDTTDPEIRSLRGLCHKYFDPGWRDFSRWSSREEAYIWLQTIMALSEDKAHISLFDKDQCLKLLEILKKSCNKCGNHPAEYDQPDLLCFLCWTEWWVDGMGKTGKEHEILLKETRRDLKKMRH